MIDLDVIPDPRRLLVALCAGVLWTLLMFGGGYFYGHHVASEDAKMAEVGRTAKAVQAKADADAQVLADERALRQTDLKEFTTFKEKAAHEKADNDVLV